MSNNNYSLKLSLGLPSAGPRLTVAFVRTFASTCLLKQTTIQLLFGRPNNPAPALPTAPLFTEHFTAIHCLARQRRTLWSSGTSNWTKNVFYRSIPNSFSLARKVKSRQHLIECGRLDTTHWLSRRWFRIVPFLLPTRDCPHLQSWIKKYLSWQQLSVTVPLRPKEWLSGWQNLMSPIVASRICSSGSFWLTTLRLLFAI